MKYQLFCRDAEDIPEVVPRIKLIWTHPPVMEWSEVEKKISAWIPHMDEFGTIIVSRQDWQRPASMCLAISDAIHSHTQEGEIVLDPFCGHSTTGVIALESHRKFIGIDHSQIAIDKSEIRLCQL